jgi:hypothetical protein
MKRFTVPCDFAGVKHPFHVYVGDGGAPECHPLKYQSHWLESVRGGSIPTEVMESFQRLLTIARENNVSFEDLCVYALGTTSETESASDATQVSVQEVAPDMQTKEK